MIITWCLLFECLHHDFFFFFIIYAVAVILVLIHLHEQMSSPPIAQVASNVSMVELRSFSIDDHYYLIICTALFFTLSMSVWNGNSIIYTKISIYSKTKTKINLENTIFFIFIF